MITLKSLSIQDIVKQISVDIGENTLIIGPSGSGKTTLIRAIAGLIKHSGTVSVDGVCVNNIYGPKRGVSVVWQDGRLIPHLSVEENLLLAGSNYKDVLEMLRIPHLLKRRSCDLSGGEAQRVNIARGLISPAKYVLMDEPMQGIDPVVVRKILKSVMHYIRQRGKIAVMVSHELYHTYGLFKKVIAFKDGQIVAHGDFESLYNDPPNPWLANFFGPYTVLGKSDLKCFDAHSNANPCMVRPEWFKVKKPPFNRPHEPNAVVTSVVWDGPSYKVNVSLTGTSKPLSVEVYTDSTFKPGESVYVNFKKCSRPAWVGDRA